MKSEDVRKVAVIGTGIMGSGIVEVCAKAGCDVVTVEVDDQAMERGRKRFEGSLAKAVDRGEESMKTAAGGIRESECVEWNGSKCITFSDPFGHGFCLIEFADETYREG